jgi:putative flippase GtrA
MQFIRYLLVQVLAYGVDMGGFILLFAHFELDPLVANTTSKVLAGLFAFVTHRSFTFGVAEDVVKVQQAVRYFALLALNIPFSALVLGAMLWVIPMAVIAKFVADMICVVLTYWLSKRFVFLGGEMAESNVVNGQGEQ